MFFVVVLFLVGDAVFHGGPEVHGDGSQLDFYRIVFVCIQTADIYAENDMMAAITVGLGVLNIVSLTDGMRFRWENTKMLTKNMQERSCQDGE